MNTSVQSGVPIVLGNPINAIDIANYIIWQMQGKNIPVTHLKLQKLLYYVLAKYVKNYGRLLVDENIYKWQYGPVVKSVYHQFKVYGNHPIVKPVSYVVWKEPTPDNAFGIGFAESDNIIAALNEEPKVNTTVSAVLDKLAYLPAFQLVEKTHQEVAWFKDQDSILRGEDIAYTIDELKAAQI